MENNEVTLKAGAISTGEITIMAIAGAGPIMCIGGSLMTLMNQTGFGVSTAAAIATLLCIFIGLSYGSLAEKYNCCGGSYAYISRIFGVKAGLWSCFVYYGVMFTTSACPATIFSTYLNSLTGIPLWVGWIIFAAVLSLITWFGVELSTKATVIVFIAEMVLVIIPAIKILSITPEEYTFASSMSNAFVPSNGANGLLLAVLTWVWAYVGFEAPSFMGEELKEGAKAIKFAIPVSALVTGIIYVVVCWLWMASMTPDQLSALTSQSDVLSAFCNMLGYSAGATMSAIGVMLAAAACGLAFWSMMPRFLYDQGRKGLLGKGVTKLNKHQIPHIGMLIYVISSFIFTMYGCYGYSASGLFNGINDHFVVMGITATTAYAFICLGNVKENWHKKGFGSFFVNKLFPIVSALVIVYIIFFTTGTKYVILTVAWYIIALILAFALAHRVKLEDLAQ